MQTTISTSTETTNLSASDGHYSKTVCATTPEKDTKFNLGKKSATNLCWKCRYATGVPIKYKTIPVTRIASSRLLPTTQTQKIGAQTKIPIYCPWVHSGKPVKGWTASPNVLTGGTRDEAVMHSYYITDCPLYKPDLEEQIALLSNSDLATWLNINEQTARIHRKEAETLLRYCLLFKDKYEEMFAKRTHKEMLKRATTDDEKNAEPAKNPICTIVLSETPIPFEKRIRNQALKEVIGIYEIDAEEEAGQSELKFLRGLHILERSIKRQDKIAKAQNEAKSGTWTKE